MNQQDNNDTFVDESIQCLAYIRGHIVNIFKALNKMEHIIESMQSRIRQIEDNMKTRNDDIESMKECLTEMETKITNLNKNIQHIKKIQEALFES